MQNKALKVHAITTINDSINNVIKRIKYVGILCPVKIIGFITKYNIV